ncbi:MAG: acyltransferase family protein [Pseudomonadota bacterium]
MNPSTRCTRLFFLDWVRILAFFVLILYHVGMYYVSWDWHVKSPEASAAIEPLMLLSSPWRLGLLFLISGVASRFMLARAGAGTFMRSRSVRLMPPLLFGMLVIVPLQPYFEVLEKLAYQGSLFDFMRLYLSAYHGFCKDGCLILPTWNHLWFVAYLLAYTLVLGALVAVLGKRLEALGERCAALLGGWKLLALPFAVLALQRLLLMPHFPTTHALVDDWYSHAHYLFLFLLGVLVARDGAFWARVGALRFPGLGVALGCWAMLVICYALPAPAAAPWWPLLRCVHALCEWSAIIAVCGFAHRHLQFDSARRRYLTEAVFPVYIVHQTLIVSIAHLIKPARIAAPIEAVVLIALTLCLSFAIFEGVRRVRLLRPLFGLGPLPASSLCAAASPACA